MLVGVEQPGHAVEDFSLRSCRGFRGRAKLGENRRVELDGSSYRFGVRTPMDASASVVLSRRAAHYVRQRSHWNDAGVRGGIVNAWSSTTPETGRAATAGWKCSSETIVLGRVNEWTCASGAQSSFKNVGTNADVPA